MLKKILFSSLTIVLLFGLILWHGRLAKAQLEAKPSAFTATRFEATFLANQTLPIDTETTIFAVRDDGSTAELHQRNDPTGGQKVFYIKKILDVTGKREVVVDPFSESTVTYPLANKTVAYHAAKPISDCGGTAAGELLGYPVRRVETTIKSEGPGFDEDRTQLWVSPRLNCFALRREDALIKGGEVIQRSTESTLTVSEGKPETSFFEIPTTYVERSPSVAMGVADRRYPGKGFCAKCSQAKKDEAYFLAWKYHQNGADNDKH